MNEPLWVYISGTMTNGDGKSFHLGAISFGMKVFMCLINKGFVPICPHLNAFCALLDSEAVSYDKWLALDKGYIDKCDVVLRLPGPSKGADIECDYARSIGVRVLDVGHPDIDVRVNLERMNKAVSDIVKRIKDPKLCENATSA